MHDFIAALLGGAMIGLAAVLLMATQGAIMGISGITSGVLPPVRKDWSWRITFLAGVLLAPVLVHLLSGTSPTVQITDNALLLVGGGLLVGLGTVIGNGCTSGHGVCGLSRFSVRSLIATGVFMLFAFGTVFILRHIVGA